MCIKVQPVCNACGVDAKEIELHECEFPGCNPEYMEVCTRFLIQRELAEWDCETPGCGLNMETVGVRIAEIDRKLRMEYELPLRPAEGDSPGYQEDNHAASETGSPKTHDSLKDEDNLNAVSSAAEAGPRPRGFDGDGSPIAHATRSTTGLKVTLHDNVSRKNSVTTNANIPTRGSSAVDANVAASDNSATNENAATNENSATSHTLAINDNVAANVANDSLATNENSAADSSIETVFDPDSVDLATFPRCRHCFLSRRRCNGQTPCDKCRQRGCPRACRPVTVELLRQHPARAERVLELARRNGASS